MLKKINYILSKSTKIKIAILSVVMVGNAFLELAGVATIYPILDIIMNPAMIHTNSLYSWLMGLFGLSTSNQFLITLCFMLIIIYAVKNIYYLVMIKIQYRLINNDEARVASQLHQVYLNQDYLFHTQHNASELITKINVNAIQFYIALQDLLRLVTDISIVLVLGIYLFITDPAITLGIVFLLCISMGLFMFIYRRKIALVGDQMQDAYLKTQKISLEAYNGIKEIKAFNREKYFIDFFSFWRSKLAIAKQKQQFSVSIPRPIMEFFGMSAVLLIIVFQIKSGADVQDLVPVLSVLTFAAMRILPAFSRIVSEVNSITVYKVGIYALYEDFLQAEQLENKRIDRKLNVNTSLSFENEITLNNISFNYPQAESPVLQNVNMNICKSEFIALVGPSGAGKTTLADIILGVIHPQKGMVMLDGIDVRENLDQWHRMLGYIPQNIYLMDDSICSNIAFGLEPEQVDRERVWQVLEQAQLADFVKHLPEGLETRVGERGVMLSGGQRQRIGIARALYSNPDILILDEATSALDSETEEAVMNAINKFKGEKTLIVIAHRLTTLRDCDRILEVNEGKVIQRNKNELIQ